MSKKFIILSVMLMMVFCSFSLSFAKEDDKEMVPAEGFFMPAGDADAGRQAFIELKCIACHTVQGDPGLPKPWASKPGPVLGTARQFYTSGEIADAIVSPSHFVSSEDESVKDKMELSRMGDFSETMTVRQLIDIVDYLNSFRKKQA